MRSMDKRLFSFSYFVHKPKGRAVWPHELRDGTAFAELVAFFTESGYAYSGPLLNYPAAKPSAEPLVIDVSFLTASDLLVLPTRPPLDDQRQGDRKQLIRGNTTLEVAVFDALKPYFEVCARSHVKLTKTMAGLLKPPYMNRAEVHFKQHAGAWYKEFKTYEGLRREQAEKNRKATAAFLVRLDHLWEDGPALLAAFSMGGVETLVWQYLLRRRYRALLETPVFVMAELEGASLPERPLTLDFAESWKVTLLINHPLVKSAPAALPR